MELHATTRRRNRWGALALGAAVVLLAPACGDDTTTADAADATTTTDAAPAAADDTAEFCGDAFAAEAAINALYGSEDGPDPEAVATAEGALDKLGSSAPDAVASPVGTVVAEAKDAIDSMGEPSAEFTTAYNEMIAWMTGACGGRTLEVGAKEYEFTLPATVEAGPTVVTFTNSGNEVHELNVVRVNDGVTETTEELLALPEDQIETKVTGVGHATATPDQPGGGLMTFEPGRYVAVCFIPVGSTPEAMADMEMSGDEPQGEPHAAQGMVAEFTVA